MPPDTSLPAALPGAPRLSVVIPACDEADNIVALVLEVDTALRGLVAYETIVVDDGSTDATLARLTAHAAGGASPLRVVRHLRNAGQSTAIRTGVRVARGEWIATLDGDGQNDPADIPGLWAQAGATANPRIIVCGHRTRRRDDWVRLLSSRIANGVRSRLLRDATPDTGCGLKIFRRETFLDLPVFDHMHRFLPALVRQCGGESISVPVNHRPRRHGVSKYGIGNRLWVGLVDLAGVAWLGRRRSLTEFEEVSPE